MNRYILRTVGLMLVGLAACTASATGYEIARSVVSGGGVAAGGGGYQLSGSIGQHAAGPLTGSMSGGGYVASAGFWTDACPGDTKKLSPGVCGCGTADVDANSNGIIDCLEGPTGSPTDGCPNDPNKTAPGQCGCGVPDTDSDGDGTADCVDGCPDDPNKTDPGICGCGVSDEDFSGSGMPDCLDQPAPSPEPGCCAPSVFPTVGLFLPLLMIGWKLRRRHGR